MSENNIYNSENKDIFLKSLSQVYSGIASESTWISNLWSPEDISAEQLITVNKLFLDMIAETRVTLGYYYSCENAENPYSYGNPKIEIKPYEANKSIEKTEINKKKEPKLNSQKPNGILIGQKSIDFE